MDELPAFEGDAFESGAPMTESGGGDFFSQELGTLLRLRYNTESYGQDRRGNLDIGTMQVANFQDAITFFDGQVTLSDVNGVGYNLGVGFRWLGWTPFPLEPERITGFNFWADGTSTESGNFFPQVGVGFESLGDMWDLRVNGYIPVGKETQIGEFSSTGAISFDENFLVQEAIADRNTSFNVAEAEIARRIMRDRDAWAFAGPYVLGNDDQDAAGYRVGMRGYAYPDLLLQIAVTDDDIFKTNAAFQVTWFVGRTRNNFQPAAGLPDRMREPVMRNDYVALQRTIEVGGGALTNTDGDPLRFVHVNADAPAGGNGTFENPLNNIGNVNGNSQEDDIILLYSDGTFTGQSTLVLQDNQRLLGEGNGEFFTVNTLQQGVVVIPETSPGARAGMRPIIMDALGLGAVQLADANEVANFNINGSAGAGIFSPTDGAGNPNIHDLRIENTTTDGIQFTPLTRETMGSPLKTVAGNVTIDDVVFDNVGEDDIDIDSDTAENINDPNVTLQEVISITDVTTTNGNNFSLNLSNTHAGAGRSTTIARFTYDGGTTGGGMLLSNYNGALNMSASTFTNGADTLAALRIGGVSDGTINLASTVTFDGVEGTVIDVGPMAGDSFTGALTVSGAITNHDSGRLVSIQRMGDSTASITLAGNMTDVAGQDSTGILIRDNTDGTILFSGNLTIDTLGDNRIGIELDTNDSTDISFNGLVDVTTNGQDSNAFDAHDGGTLTVLGNNNTLMATGGAGLRIVDMTISTAAVKFAEINVAAGVGPVTTPDNGIFLQGNTGGAIDLGILTDPVGDSGTIAGTSGAAVVIANSANVTVSGMRINATAGQTGVEITKNTTGTQTTNLNNLDVNDGATGIDVIGNGTGTLNLTVNDTTIDMPTGTGLSFNNIDDGTIGINNLDVDGVGVTSTAGVSIVNSDATFTFDADSSIQGVDGADFNVNGGDVAITMGGDITNTVGRSIAVQNITGGNVSFTSTSAVNDDGAGILVNGNTAGTIEFEGSYDLDTTTNDAVTITNNTGATINFTPLSAAGSFDIDTTTGSGFVATGGGTLTVSGAGNTITGTALGAGKFGLQIEGMTIDGVDGVGFESVNATGGDSGIRLVNNLTGTVTVGDTSAAVGLGGTITGTTDNGVHVQNTNVVLNGVSVTNAGGAGDDAVLIQHSNTANMTASLNNLTINTTQNGLHIDGTGGTNTFNVNSTNGTITATGTDIEVEGRLSTVNLTQNVTSTAGRSIQVHDVTAGTMTHTGTVTDTGGTGVQINNNTGGNINLLGSYALNTGANDAVSITNNTGATIQLTNLNIDTTSGDGFVATGGGTLTVSGTTNTIDTTTGVGLDVEDMTIGVGGANFQSVTVTGGATNGIILDTLTGGQVQIGNVAGAANSGGSLTTAGDAIVLTNVQNVDLRHIRIVDVTGAGGDGIVVTHSSAGTTAMDVTIDDLNLDAATARGINLLADNDGFNFAMRLTNSDIDNADVLMSVTGAGQFGLLVDSTDISTDPGIAGRAFDLQFSGGATDGDVTIRSSGANVSNFTASDGEALFIDSSGATPKDIKLLVEDSTFSDSLGTEIAAVINNQGTSLMQVTIQGNTFASALATRDLNVVSSGTAASQVRLNLGGDITSPADFNTAAGQGTMLVSQNGTSIYGIFDLNGTTVTDTRNNSPVDTNGGVFQNLVVPPTLPTVP